MKLTISLHKFLGILMLLTFLFGYIGIIFDYGFPIYSILVIFSFLIMLSLKSSSKVSVHYFPFFIFYVYFLIHFFASGLHYFITIGEFINGFTTILLLIIFPTALPNSEDFDKFLVRFRNLIIFSAILFSIIGLYKFLLFAISRKILSFLNHLSPLNTELIDDYNFFAAGLLIGLITLGYKVSLIRSRNFLYYIAFIIISLAILFSGSRRGAIILFLYILLIIGRWFYTVLKDLLRNRFNKRNLIIILFSLFILFISWFVLKRAGFLEIGEIKFFINKIFNRLLTILSFSDDFTRSSRGLIFENTIEMIKEGSFFQIIFGQGFSYISKLGEIFGVSEQYPHSQILSQMIFGGIVGMFLLLGIFIHIFFIIKFHYKDYKDIIWAFIILLFFCQFSGNTFLSFKTTLVFYIIIINLPKYRRGKVFINNEV